MKVLQVQSHNLRNILSRESSDCSTVLVNNCHNKKVKRHQSETICRDTCLPKPRKPFANLSDVFRGGGQCISREKSSSPIRARRNNEQKSIQCCSLEELTGVEGSTSPMSSTLDCMRDQSSLLVSTAIFNVGVGLEQSYDDVHQTVTSQSISTCVNGTEGLRSYSWPSFLEDHSIHNWHGYHEQRDEADRDAFMNELASVGLDSQSLDTFAIRLTKETIGQHDQQNKTHNQQSSKTQVIPEFLGDKLARAVFRSKKQKELAKAQKKRMLQEFDLLSFDDHSGVHEKNTGSDENDNILVEGCNNGHAKQWLEVERQKAMLEKWQHKKKEQWEQYRLSQVKHSAILEQRKKEPFRVLEQSPMMKEDPFFAKQVKHNSRHRLREL